MKRCREVLRRVTPGYLETMRIPVIQGRGLTGVDGAEGQPEVVVVDRALADRFFPDGALGKRVKFGPTESESPYKTIVGVVEDVKQVNLGEEAFPGVYVPYRQSPTPSLWLVLRGGGDPFELVAPVRQQVWALDSELPVFGAQTMAQRMAQSDWEEQLFAWIFTVFSSIALALACVGIYGVVAYTASQRLHVIGIRVALGADRRAVLRLVLRQGMKPVVVGVVVGIVGALTITRVLASLLFEVSPTDPQTFVGVAATLCGLALFACYLPARRATRTDPVTALRRE